MTHHFILPAGVTTANGRFADVLQVLGAVVLMISVLGLSARRSSWRRTTAVPEVKSSLTRRTQAGPLPDGSGPGDFGTHYGHGGDAFVTVIVWEPLPAMLLSFLRSTVALIVTVFGPVTRLLRMGPEALLEPACIEPAVGRETSSLEEVVLIM